MAPQFPETRKNKLNVALDLRIVVIVLLLIIAAMFAMWRPWTSKTTSERTVRVTGDATVKATPDEYVFYPSYQFENNDKTAALKELTAKSDEIVAKLKTLGVADKDIKTNSSGYDYPVYYDSTGKTATYTLSLTVTTHDLTAAQKVEDYLVTTAPTGSVSPQATFSETKRKQVEAQARTEAAKDARTKADDMGKNVGFKVSKVKTISDDQGFGGGIIRPYAMDDKALASGSDMSTQSLTVQPGENDLTYTVTVEYYIK